MPDPNETRQALIDKRRELQERVEAVRKDFAGGLDPDLDEQAIQLENAEVLNELLREALSELEDIELKLRRMERK
jgi:RNA polymerase-binding transcription factor DksA